MSVKNVLLAIYDSVRPDFLGCYGHDVQTPALDALASGGVQFKRVISAASWTLPSIVSIISGVYSYKLGMFRWDQSLSQTTKTLFHYLSYNGYEVGSFVFDERYLFSHMEFANVVSHSRDFDKVLHWVKDHRHKPFFLCLHSFGTHIPWTPQKSAQEWSAASAELQRKLREEGETGRQECISLYRDAIETASETEIASLVGTLVDTSLLDNTLLVFVSDHGESWGERFQDKSEITCNFDLHGWSLYEECLRVPLIFHCPSILPAGVVVESQVRTVDILPTVLDLVGMDLPTQIDGQSLKESFTAPVVPDLPAMSFTTRTVVKSISDASTTSFRDHLSKLSLTDLPWKLIWSIHSGKIELYNLDADPGERENQAHSSPSIVDPMMTVLRRELSQVPAQQYTPEEEARVLERLKKLGYV